MSFQINNKYISLIKICLFVVGLLPATYLIWAILIANIFPEPVEYAQHWTGFWTSNFLLLTLLISPLRSITQQHWLLRLRRMLGLFTFAYATLHLFSFIWLDNHFIGQDIINDVAKKPFITIGLAAYLLLIPLAATSNQWSLRSLGGHKWQELHRNIYLIAILACVHFLWLSKIEEIIWPIIYSATMGVLLYWRVQERRKKAIPAPTKHSAKPIKFFPERPK